MMKRILLLIICIAMLIGSMCADEIFRNEQYHFSFTVPEGCCVYENIAADKEAAYYVYRSSDRQLMAYIYYHNDYQKDKAQDYKKMRDIIRKNDTCTLIEERPFYDLLRQQFAYLRTYPDGSRSYIKTLIKVSSYITITCLYPLVNESRQVLETFDNEPSFRGNLRRVLQNAGSISICIYLTLLCLFGYNSRGNKGNWIYILLSILLLVIAVCCLWQDKIVMAFILAISLIIWAFFASHNKALMWLIDSIFGA